MAENLSIYCIDQGFPNKFFAVWNPNTRSLLVQAKTLCLTLKRRRKTQIKLAQAQAVLDRFRRPLRGNLISLCTNKIIKRK